MHFFGSKKKSSAPAAPTSEERKDDRDVMRNLASSKELIDKRSAHLTRKMDAAVLEAIEHKQAGRKAQAIACLKRKKQLEKELDGLIESGLRAETLDSTIQAMRFTETTIEAERAATALIKAKVARLGGADAVDDARAETEDALAEAYDLLGVASEPIALPGLGDDDELEAELNELIEASEQGKLSKQLTQTDGEAGSSGEHAAVWPSAPTAKELAEERELAEIDALTASMKTEAPMAMPMRAMGGMVPCA